jgi:hypothetical protein
LKEPEDVERRLRLELLDDVAPAPPVPGSGPGEGPAVAEGADAGREPGEPERERVVLERLVAVAAEGGEARALYRLREEGSEERPAAKGAVFERNRADYTFGF